jgi:aminoglycoside/choline kinase family phosphotransferase
VELPIYDATELQRELDICPEWFFSKVLGITLDETAFNTFRAFSECLVAASISQPQGLVHRDFHSRNLMVLGSNVSPAVIDFQDAIIGPLTYDAVSLLKDVYIVWPRERQLEWLTFYWEALVSLDHLPEDSWAEFVRCYDLIGLQRHTKILGIFARLWLRDHKPSYMADISVVVGYIEEACDLYAEEFPEVGEFWKWFEVHVLPKATRAAWYKTA